MTGCRHERASLRCYDQEVQDDSDGESRPLPDIPPTGWAVLGLLSSNESGSGYDVKKWADWSIGHFYWSPSFSQVYSEMKRLEKLGLAKSWTEKSAGERSRRLYAVTEEGHRALEEWVMTGPVDLPILKHPVLMRIWLGHLSSPDRLKAILTDYMDQLRDLIKTAENDGELATIEPSWAYPRLALRWAHRHYQAELELAQDLYDEIDATYAALTPALDENGRLIPPAPDRWREVDAMARAAAEASTSTNDAAPE